VSSFYYDSSSLPKSEAGEAGLIYAEGTAAQIGATLAGLRAQPDVFLSVSIKPTHDGAAPYLVSEEVGRQQLSGGQSQSKPTVGGMGFGAGRAKAILQTPARAAKAEVAPGDEIETRVNTETLNAASSAAEGRARGIQRLSSDAKGQERGQVGIGAPEPVVQPLAQLPPRQRVLFMVRVVGGEQPPADAAKVRTAAEAEPAKPAEQSTPPADRPAQEE
jgi:hypothetical protein